MAQSSDVVAAAITPNLDNIRAWAEALESGEFIQGIGELRQRRLDGTFRYCCLGVATEMAIRAGVVPYADHHFCTETNTTFNIPDVDPEHTHSLWCTHDEENLSPEVCDWLGVAANPDLGVNDIEASSAARVAITLNDDLKQSFVQIAARIRRKYLGENVEVADLHE